MGKWQKAVLFLGVLSTVCAFKVFPTRAQGNGATPTEENLKVAFIGDSGDGADFEAVLNLIKAEGAQLVLHQGDFSYNGTQTWAGLIDSILGADFPYLGSDGNHDNWADYAPFFRDRVQKLGLDPNIVPTGDSNYALNYKGLRLVFNKEGGDATFSQQALAGDGHIWKICSWHHNRADFQAGGKGNSVDLATYENCAAAGALIATGHEHSYSRTCTLTDIANAGADYGADCANPALMRVGPGESFVHVSGLGGKSARNYHAGEHDDDAWWATIYTSNRYCKNTCTSGGQQDKSADIGSYGYDFGALFITFNVDGNPYKARGYFKTISGEIIDEFEVFANGEGGVTPSPTSTYVPTIPPVSCSVDGDYNGDGAVDTLDYTKWRSDFLGGQSTLACFEYWRRASFDFGATLAPTQPPQISPTAGISPPAGGGAGIYISPERLASLPTSGTAWENLLAAASSSAGTPDLPNQDDGTNVIILAKALVYARTGDSQYLNDVKEALSSIAGAGGYSGRALALGRELGAYVVAADLVNLSDADPELDSRFRAKIRELLTTPTSSGPESLVECHENRPNNWGTHCGGARAAVAAYLGDSGELARTAEVFRGWLGDRGTYAGFSYGDLSWQCDESKPVGINPAGCTKEGFTVDGVLPDDQRRGGGFTASPPCENYVWEGLQGAHLQAVILSRAGYDVWSWEEQALRRGVEWLHAAQVNGTDWCAASGDDNWQPHLTNYYYGTNFPAESPSNPGKNLGWTDWTHGR